MNASMGPTPLEHSLAPEGSAGRMLASVRTIMIVILLFVAIVAGGPLAQGRSQSDELSVALKMEAVKLINRDRVRAGLSPVQLDPAASQIADAYCARQILNRTSGHFTVDGQTPYMRYSFAGGNDGVSENAAAWSANYDFSDSQISELVVRSQDAMISEKPPKDGHRKTILDPHATHVGIGVAWDKGEFRFAQEFIRRYVDWRTNAPRVLSEEDETVIAGRPHAGYRVDAITVYREPFPRMIPAAMASKIENYGFPSKRRDYLPQSAVARGGKRMRLTQVASRSLQKTFPVADDGGFSFTLRPEDGPGVYTVVVWITKDGLRDPIAASNIAVRVIPPLTTATK